MAPRRGDGYEFAELRAYVEGDDPRRIDWAATARAGALQTRIMLEDAALVLGACIDASASMHVGRATTNYDAACAVARAWYGAATDDDRCARIGERSYTFSTVRGRAAASACMSLREPVGGPFGAALRRAAQSLARDARLLVVSDFYEIDALAEALRACTARFDVTALLARDPWHAGLPLGGFIHLRDAESERSVRIYVDRRARERYRRAVAQRERAVLGMLRDAGARAALLDAAQPAETGLAQAFGIV